MGQEVNSQSVALKGSLDSDAAVLCKNVKISYTREFLLSFAEVESCKIQPSGLDPQVLRTPLPGHVVEGANASTPLSTRGLIHRDKDGDRNGESFQNIPEWRRPPGNPGGLLSQGSKRNEHGGALFTNNFTSRSGPSRGETSHPRSNYDRSGWQGPGSGGVQGRWEHRSGSSDREKDRSHHDHEALEQDSGRRFHGSDHLTWQGGITPEHDGLLGSGSDLRSSRSSGGSVPPNMRGHDRPHASEQPHHASDFYQQIRSSKIGTHSRPEIRDIYNDETFGSDIISDHERTEEERRRRDSFELMRKEQHKLLQEKQKLNLQKQGEHFDWESTVSSDKEKDEKCAAKDGKKLEDQLASIPLPDHSMSSASIKTNLPGMPMPASRPLVPPGFAKVFLEKQVSLKSGKGNVSEAVNNELMKDHIATNLHPYLEGNGHQMKERQLPTLDVNMNKHQEELSGQETSAAVDVGGNVKDLLGLDSFVTSQYKRGFDTVSNSLKTNRIVSLPEIEHDGWNLVLDILDIKKAEESETGSNNGKEKSESVLDRLFGKASADFEKPDIPNPDDEQTQVIKGNNRRAPKSSKFARWFHTEEEKPSDGMPIHNAPSEKVMIPSAPSEDRVLVDETPNSPLSSIFPIGNTGKVLPMPDGPSLEDVEKVMTATVKQNIHDEMGQFQLTRNRKSYSFGLHLNVDTDESLTNKEILSNSSRKPRVVLTCEDLEQSIIAEASESVSKVLNYSEENHNVPEGNLLAIKHNLSMDNHASQHLLSLLQKGTNMKDPKSPMMQYHKARHVVPSKEADHHENADKDDTREKTGAQTLEFLFGKAFMNELRSADAPVSVKAPIPLKTKSNDLAVEDSGMEPSVAMSLDRQNCLPNAEFEARNGKLDAFPSSRKMTVKDGKILGLSQEASFDDSAYALDKDPWHSTANLNHGIQNNIGISHFENEKGVGNRKFALFGTGPKAVPDTVEEEYSSSLNSDLGSDVLETTRFQKDRNSVKRGLFDSGSKKPIFDAGNMQTGHLFMGKSDCIDSKLTSDGRSSLLGRSSSNGKSASLPILDEFLRSSLTGSQMSDNFNFSDVPKSTPAIVQKPVSFTDEKSRYEDHSTRVHEAVGQHYRGGDNPVLESRIPLNDMVGTSRPAFTNSISQSGGVDQANFHNSGGIHHLLGLPSHSSHLPQQQLSGLADVPLSHSLSGPRARPSPAFFPYHHGPAPYDLNLGAINAMPNQQINHEQPPQSRQMKFFDHGNSLESQHPSPDSWSDHLPRRALSQEPSGQMLYPLHNGPPMNQSVYHSLRPHGLAPNHFLQPVPVLQRGVSSLNNFPFIPEQQPHAPHGLPSNYPQHVAGLFIPEIPVHSMQGPPFHIQPSHTALGTAHNQSLRPNLGTPPEFNVSVDGRLHAGAMVNDGAVLEILFAKESKRQQVGSVPVNQYPGRNMGYG